MDRTQENYRSPKTQSTEAKVTNNKAAKLWWRRGMLRHKIRKDSDGNAKEKINK